MDVAQAAQAEAEQQRVQLGKLGAAQRARARACGEEIQQASPCFLGDNPPY